MIFEKNFFEQNIFLRRAAKKRGDPVFLPRSIDRRALKWYNIG